MQSLHVPSRLRQTLELPRERPPGSRRGSRSASVLLTVYVGNQRVCPFGNGDTREAAQTRGGGGGVVAERDVGFRVGFGSRKKDTREPLRRLSFKQEDGV